MLVLLQQVREASLIPELSFLAEDVPRGDLHPGGETHCGTTTNGSLNKNVYTRAKQEGRGLRGRSWVLYFSLDFVVKFSTPWQSQLRILGIKMQVCETGQTAYDNFQSLCPICIFLHSQHFPLSTENKNTFSEKILALFR